MMLLHVLGAASVLLRAVALWYEDRRTDAVLHVAALLIGVGLARSTAAWWARVERERPR